MIECSIDSCGPKHRFFRSFGKPSTFLLGRETYLISLEGQNEAKRVYSQPDANNRKTKIKSVSGVQFITVLTEPNAT